jgi:SSS family solute:Na+ symporter
VDSSQFWLIVSIALYMVVMLGIGVWTSRKIHDTHDYILAGKRLGWWLSIGTIFATWFGAETCMGSSRTAYEKGILGVIADPFGAALCLILAGLFFAKFFHDKNYKTLVDYFDQRFGRWAAGLLSVLYIPVYVGWVGAQLLAFGIILNSVTGIEPMTAIIISTAVVIVYTYMGGMWAVSVTDLVQMLILIAGFLVLFPILYFEVGGFGSLRAQLPPEMFHFWPHQGSTLDWLMYLQAWMLVGLGSLPGQDLFQRLMSPRSAHVAKWSSVIAGVLYVVIGLFPVLMGMMGRIALPTVGRSESILIDLARAYLPLPLIALMLGALLSAIMSTVSAALLAPASIIGHNIIPFFYPRISESAKLQWCKSGIWIIGVISFFVAIYFQNVYTLCTQSWGILLVGVAAPLIFGVFWKKTNTAGALAGAVAGTVSWIVLALALSDDYPTHLFGFAISCVTLVVVTLLTSFFPRSHSSQAEIG